jgi:methylmalonyl-CoA mutase C-terminal domain/subunit
LFPQVVGELASRQGADIIVFGGGVIPDADIPDLVGAGLATVFTPGAPLDEITDWVDAHVPSRSNQERGTS